MEIVVHDRRRDRLARDVHDVGARLPQQHEQTEKSLLVLIRARELEQLFRRKGHARDDDDRLRRVPIGKDVRHERRETPLKRGESCPLVDGAGHRIFVHVSNVIELRKKIVANVGRDRHGVTSG